MKSGAMQVLPARNAIGCSKCKIYFLLSSRHDAALVERKLWQGRVLLKFATAFQRSFTGSAQILRFLVQMALVKPKLVIAVVLLVLAGLAGTMTYTGFLVIGVLAGYLDTSRVVAGLLLGAVFARFPWMRKGKPRIVGLLPQPARRPLMLGLLALCLFSLLSQAAYVPAVFTTVTIAFLLAYPWLKRAVVARVSSSVVHFAAGKRPGTRIDDTVIEGDFREKKD